MKKVSRKENLGVGRMSERIGKKKVMTWIRDKYKTLEKFLLLRRVREKWENSSYRVAMKDPEGDLLIEGYRRRRDGMFRGYFLTGVMSLYFVSRVIVRIVKGYEFVVLPAGISVMSAIVIISVHVMFMSEFIMMYRVYRKKKGDRLGVYREQRRGMMGGDGSKSMEIVDETRERCRIGINWDRCRDSCSE